LDKDEGYWATEGGDIFGGYTLSDWKDWVMVADIKVQPSIPFEARP
jgi:hypothetical protein